MNDKLKHRLLSIGFDPLFEELVQQSVGSDSVPARIAAEHRGLYEVWSAEGEGSARLTGRLMNELSGEEFPGVGDWVLLKSVPSKDGTTVVEQVLPRRTVFIRGAAGRETRGQVVAANVDVVFAVCGLDADFNVRRIERYLARIWASGAEPIVVLNKADVCEDLEEKVEAVESVCFGVTVKVTSAVREEGLEGVRAHISDGITAAFVGSSGAGKSTLINALIGEELMPTRETRARDGRGCHTTTHRQLILLPTGGLLIDTPGMRELQLTDEEGLGTVFSDIEEISENCRYRDCSHQTEPGCAVAAAVEAGDISPDRLDSYLKLGKEAKAYELRNNEHMKRKSEKVWGQLYKEADRIRKWKSGQ